jgi:hypothetical protein
MEERVMKRGIVSGLVVAAAVAAFWPAAGSAAGFKGIVVAKQHGSLLVVSPSGALRTVHARASIGARLVGTTVVGRAAHARIHGIVVRRIGTTLVLSSNRHLIAIPNRVGRRLADTTPTPTTTTTPGAVVNADVVIKNGELEEEDEDEVGQVNASTLTIQATVKAVAAGTVTLDVQGQSVTVPLPAGLTLPASLVGQTVTLNVALDDEQGDNDDQSDDHGHNRGHDGDGGDDD